MSRLLSSVLLVVLPILLFAQAPEWLDPATRATSYPDDLYLSAFATEVLAKNQSEADAQSKLFEIVKSQISDEISVSINAQTTLNITVDNAATDQKLERKSASSSEVDLVGLKLDAYYEKRKKSVHAFAYVSIEELARFHRNVINEKSLAVSSNLSTASTSSDKLQQIKLHVENKRLLKEIEKSAKLLTALSEPHGADLPGLKKTSASNDQKLNQLFHTGTVALEHIAARLTGELLNGIRQGASESVKATPLAYSNSGVESSFSSTLAQSITSALGESSSVTVGNSSTGKLSGSFKLNDKETVFTMSIFNDASELVSSSEFAVLTSIINTKGQQLLPTNFEYIPMLDEMSIDAAKQFAIKPSEYTDKPFNLRYSINGKAVPNLAITVVLENDGKSSTYDVQGDVNGTVAFYLDESMVTPGTDYLATFTINLEKYLSIEPGNDYLKQITSEQTVPVFNSSLSVLSPLVWITSTEDGISGPLAVKVLEPAVKAGLSELRYAFTEDPASADYNLSIEAKARQGQAGEIATLTFVDATISLINNSNGKEIYKNSFFNIKGIGANFDVAQSSAFQKTKTQMVDDITYELEYNR